MNAKVANHRPLLALAIRLVTALIFATMAMFIKLAGARGVNLLELIFYRQALTLLLTVGLLAAWGRLASVATQRFGAHIARALYGIIGMACVYGAILILPLAEATTISFTTPFFAVLLAVLLLHERVGIYRWGAIAMGFAGVLLVVQPGGGAINPVGAIVGLAAAFMVALVSIKLQDLNTTEAPWTIIFWFTALTTPLAALGLPFVASSHDPQTWTIIFAVALCGALAQAFLTTSLRYGPAATVIVMDYTSLIWATLYGWLVFDQIPSTNLWLGAPLIMGAGLIVALRESALAIKRSRAGLHE